MLLGRYGGTEDVAVGTAVSLRGRPGLERLAGYGINSLVLRNRWTGTTTFAELLDRTRGMVLDAFDHQATPFARLVDALAPERDLSRTPLFQVVFDLVETRGDGFALPGVTVGAVTGERRTARFDLTLQIEERADGTMTGHLEYATGLFDAATAHRMAGHYVRLLETVTAAPSTPLRDVDLLTPRERHRIVAEWNDTAGRLPDRALPETIFERVAEVPDATAIRSDRADWTFGELGAYADRVAAALRAAGIGTESVVGVLLERSPELVGALLGVWRAGGAYVPLDPESPADRTGYVLGDADARVVVTDRALAARLPDGHPPLLLIDELPAAGLAHPPAPVDQDTLAYVIYTSGSTGRPKGVQVTHRGLANYQHWTAGAYATAPGGAPLFSPITFDLGVPDLYTPLMLGRPVHLLPDGLPAADLADELARRGPFSFVKLTPGHLDLLTELPDAQIAGLAGLVVAAGDAFTWRLAERWRAAAGEHGTRLAAEYGPTEITVGNSGYPVTGTERGELVPLGTPIVNTTMYVLDRWLNPVPPGVIGEIYIGGAGLARGYARRPDLTARAFLPDPFGPPGARLYRTGDLGRLRPDGVTEFAGRVDHQVKIRGHRIELGEIETVLAGHPAVQEAVAAVHAGELVGYVVPAEGHAVPHATELAVFCRATLPDYMVPAAFVTLAAIPLTGNGKVDRRLLPAPEREDTGVDTAFVGPRTAVEERVAAAWAQVLGLERVGVHDSFFDVGGDSIKAVAMVGELRAAGLDVAVRDVFEYRTVAELCEFATGRAAPSTPVVPVAPFAMAGDEDRARLPRGVVDAYPLSQVQLGMLVEMLADDGVNKYHNTTSFRIRDDAPFSADALRAAAALVTERHEVLRTSFDLETYTTPLQLVHGTAEVPIGVQDLSHLDEQEIERELHEFTRRDRARLFDLRRPPMLRLFAHLCDDKTWWLSVTECHPILEGWSHHSLLMELLDAYRAIRSGQAPAPAGQAAVRYADFIAAEVELLDRGDHRDYWQEIVDGYPGFAMPAGWGDTGTENRKHQFVIPFHDLEPGLRALAARARASLKSVLLAAHFKVLSQLTPEERFCAGLVCNARPEVVGADRVYGMYLNTLPFAFDRPAGSWLELVRDVFDREVQLWPHRFFPMPVIQREMADERLVQVSFSYQDFHQVDTELIDYLASIDDSPTEFPLSVSTRVGYVIVTTSTGVVSRANAARLQQMYRGVLESMAADPLADAARTYLPSGEDALVLGDASPPMPAVVAVPELVAAQDPAALAVECGEVRWTFGDLRARADRLAGVLAGHGVGCESVVAVVMDRSAELIGALYGVWRSGGAYLPLDPMIPVDRLRTVLADAGVRVVVTQESLRDRIPAGHEVVCADAELPESGFAPRPVDLDSLAYVIYTSGSTGRPKGVLVSHRGVANHIAWAVERLAGSGSGGGALFSSVAFDLPVPNVWAPLAAGQRLAVAPAGVGLDTLGPWLLEHGPFSFLKLTPGYLRVLTDQGAVPRAGAMVVAGEALPVELAREGLINEYGPTEASVGSSIFEIGAVEPGPVPIGRALPGMALYVLDPRMRPVPYGVVGELFVGGVGVARGYLGRPGLTAQRFVPDPFGTGRLYRTGDLVRRRGDGQIEFLGRVDDQVKVRGYRVELGEVRAALVAHERVTDAYVLPVGDGADIRLVAYVVGVGGEEILGHLRTRLPDYMVPAQLIAVDALPLNRNGKVDRTALPDPDLTADRYEAPRTVTEQRIADVWAQVLGLERVGRDDSFFDVGGHSIRAVMLVGALRTAGFDIGVRDVFEHRTVAALCELVTGRPAPAAAAVPVAPFALIGAADRALLPDGLTDAYPLSQVQLGMLVEMLADTRRRPYHNVASFRIRDDGPFSADALRAAADLVTARHEMLRTSFDLDTCSVPMQLVHASARIPLTVTDLREVDATEVEQRLRAHRAAERADVFTPGDVPMLRMAVHRDADDAWWLSLTVAHAITEGWSHRTLMMELLDAYREFRDGRPPAPEAPPSIRYADFVAAELASIDGDGDRAYWQDVIDRYPRFTLPPAWADLEPEPAPFRAGVPLTDLEAGLRALAARARASLKSVLLAAHFTVLSQLTPDERFCAGLVTSARPEAVGADRVYGMYLNTLPFAFDRPAGTWLDVVRSVFDREVELWPHRAFPMPVIQREMAGDRLLDVRFSYQDFDQVDTERVDVDASLGEGATEFPLAVAAVGGYLVLTTNTGVLSRANAERLVQMYRSVLEAMAADPLGDASGAHLPAGETGLVLGDVSPAPSVLVAVPELVAAQDPAALAVECGEVRWTFGDLRARADRLAGVLAGHGVGCESVVAVVMDRSAELIGALYGVWRSGGAYLPLDPMIPVDRLRTVLADAGVRVVVTQESLRDRIPAGHEVVCADAELPESGFVPRPVDLDSLAYVIYTSGSTGRPKGVLVSHRGVANHIAWAVERLAGSGSGGGALFSSVAFDLPVPNVWAPLAAGQRLAVAPAGVGLDTLGPWLLEHGPFSFLKLTPGYLRVLTEQMNSTQAGTLAAAMVVAGEVLPPELASLARQATGPGRLINEYGPTEASVGSSIFEIGAVGPGPVPIGRALPGMALYVLNSRLRPVPLGVAGELFVGGVGVARGYLGRPDLTAQRFVPDPFGGGRLYRTGDLVRRRGDGQIEFLGRVDDQVKVRGYRVELGEVRAALVAHERVTDAFVLPVGEGADIRLVAYVVGESGDAVSEHLRERLPDYMVPAQLIAVDALPLNRNGKVDRTALPDPDLRALRSTHAYVAPATRTEQILAGIWTDVLGVARVGTQDRFFDLGGHSLLMIKVLAEARKHGLSIAIWRMYQQETLAELARSVDEDQLAAARQVPLTAEQRRLRAAAGHHRAVLPLGPAADGEILTRVWETVLTRHTAVWLRPAADADHAVLPDPRPQTVAPTPIDVAQLSAADQEAAVAQAADRIAADLEAAPGQAIRGLLVRHGDASARLLLIADALLVDEPSLLVVADELATGYALATAGEPVELPTAPDWCAWADAHAARAGGDDVTARAHLWLHRPPVPALPVDGAGEPGDEVVTVALDAGLTRALTARSAQDGWTVEEALLATLAAVLTGWTGGDRALIDVAGDLRPAGGGVGQFGDLTPVAMWIPPRATGTALVRAVRDQLRPMRGDGAYGLLRHAPDPEIAEALAAQPPAEVRFSHTPPAGTRALVRSSSAPRTHALDVRAASGAGQLYLRWSFDPARHDEATVRRLAHRHLELLTGLTSTGRAAPAVHRRTHHLDLGTLLSTMESARVPGVSIAILRDGEIADVHCAGVRSADGSDPVTPETVFQAGSISKHVTALGTLRLVRDGVLALDTDVNDYLTSWRVPTPGVTVRHLLGNVAGLAVTPHKGYQRGAPVADLLDLLNGTGTITTPPVRVELTPGTTFRRSNVHWSVLQQLLTDVTGRRFPDLMRELVLDPLGMTHSGYEQSWPEEPGREVAVGHDQYGVPMPGGWRVRLEVAAAGLWSTATDLARLAPQVRRAYLGRPSLLLTPELAAQQLTPHPGAFYGLGAIVDDTGADVEFGHGGEPVGYWNMAISRVRAGSGFVALTNGESGKEVVRLLAAAVGRADEDFGRGELAADWAGHE
ncbi:hypothetical protein JCM9534A_05170 [Catenuloplanes indicus JCM 9534]